MQRRKVLTILSTPIIAAALILSASPANASIADEAKPDGYVIVDLSQATSTNARTTNDGVTFYPTGPISEGTLVVIPQPDGSLPGGLTVAELNEKVAQSKSHTALIDGSEFIDASVTTNAAAQASPTRTAASYAYSANSSTTWSRNFQGTSIWGYDATARVQYNFSTPAGYNQTNAGQGLGYYVGYNGSEMGLWSQFYNLGSARPGVSGGGSVPWGEVLATAQFRAKCATSTVCWGNFNNG